jgi:hypothetical protein
LLIIVYNHASFLGTNYEKNISTKRFEEKKNPWF